MRFLAGEFEPGEDDDLVRLGLHGALEVGDLAVRHVVAPGFDHAGRAEFLEQRRRVGSVLAIGLLVGRGYGGNESAHVGHALLLLLRGLDVIC